MGLKNQVETLLRDAAEFGPKIHAERGLTYSDLPYQVHLQMVVNFANYFRPLLRMSPEEFYEVLMACWLHDTVEDCGISYGKIEKKYGRNVAEYVWAVSGFGRNRKERNACVEPKIKGNLIPTYVKMCDRLANVTFSKFFDPGSRMYYGQYVVEWSEFKNKYYIPELDPMFAYMDKLIDLT